MGTDAHAEEPAERVLLVSLMKSGTHLIQELMVALGYGIHGQSRITPEIKPRLDQDTKQSLVRLVFGGEAAENADSALADRAWEAFGWAWQYRLGSPLANRYGTGFAYRHELDEVLQRTADTGFHQTPANVCWILPQLDIGQVDGRFLADWSDTGHPRVIFNYRDPRDVLLSMINFLSGGTAKGYGNFSDFKVFARILDSKNTLTDKLRYALLDPAFPGHGDFERSLWLLHHPGVCKVSFEELVGKRGGGSDSAQADAIQRVTSFLATQGSPGVLAQHLFNRDSFSFYKGQIGTWREEMNEDEQRLCSEALKPILTEYGYDTE